MPSYHANMTTPAREADCTCHQGVEGEGMHHDCSLKVQSCLIEGRTVHCHLEEIIGASYFGFIFFRWILLVMTWCQFQNKWLFLEHCSVTFGVFLTKVSCPSAPAKVASQESRCVNFEVGFT